MCERLRGELERWKADEEKGFRRDALARSRAVLKGKIGEQLAPLGNADAASCADYVVTLLSDLTRMVTMQTLYHDGGFSSMGVSDELIEALQAGSGA